MDHPRLRNIAFFALLLVFVASPFATQAAAADGAGLTYTGKECNPWAARHPDPF